MSLILEALRKSEAERRRAQVPDLLTEAQAAAPVAARPAPHWPMWLGSAVVAVAAVWFVASRDVDAPARGTSDASDVATSDAASPAPADDTAAREAARARPAPALQRPLVVAAPAPAPEAPATARPQPATDATPQAVASTPAALPAAPPRAERVPTPPAPTPVAASTIERVTDLGSADRKQLPPLKLSMHMWNDVVAQRVVIIDGTRLGVGDRLGAVVVADIVPDGVLLDWNGRALKLPLR